MKKDDRIADLEKNGTSDQFYHADVRWLVAELKQARTLLDRYRYVSDGEGDCDNNNEEVISFLDGDDGED